MESGRPDARQRVISAGHELLARKGYTAVGITEILRLAGVPKGSFYHYFPSKDAFGEAVVRDYFATYLLNMDRMFARVDAPASERLMDYWRYWYGIETGDDFTVKCLAVKVGAEVADLSGPMRTSLREGTSAVIGRVAGMIEAGAADGSVPQDREPMRLARFLYDLWLGASVRAKIDRDTSPLDDALTRTREELSRRPG